VRSSASTNGVRCRLNSGRKLRNRWQQFKSLPPEQQQRVRQSFQRFRQMPPEQRTELRRQWRQMSPRAAPERHPAGAATAVASAAQPLRAELGDLSFDGKRDLPGSRPEHGRRGRLPVGRCSARSAVWRDGTNYVGKRGVTHSEIMAPAAAPHWAHDREAFVEHGGAGEFRKDSQLARLIEVGLPIELSADERVTLVRDYVAEEFVAKG